MKRRLLFLLVGGFFYMCLLLLWGRQYTLLKVQAKEITDVSNGYISSLEEIEQASDYVLSDSIQYIGEVNELEDSKNDSYSDTDTSEDDISENDEVMNEDQFRIMVIFCFGLCAGVVVGHFLTGFIK